MATDTRLGELAVPEAGIGRIPSPREAADDVSTDIDQEPPTPAPVEELPDPTIAPRLFSPAEVRRAAWQASPLVTALMVVAFAAAGAVLLSVRFTRLSGTPEYHGAAAGGLLTLAGIVPAALGAVATGRPVTRLDGGRLMTRGLAGWVAAGYCLVWAAALTLPLFGLLGGWAWLKSPYGAAWALALLVLTTLGTPIVFMVLAARLHPRLSTMMAVARATGGRRLGASDEAARCALVKDLRDLASSEYNAGDRRAVRHRLAGLATIGTHVTHPRVADLALDELGLLCQRFAEDRDLAREGVALLRTAAAAIPDGRPALLERVVAECTSIWRAAAGSQASASVAHAAVVAATEAALRGESPLQRLAALLRAMAETSGEARSRAAQDIVAIEQAVHPEILPTTDGVARAWVQARRSLGPDGFALLVDRIAHLDPSARSDAAKSVAQTAAHLALSHVDGLSLMSSEIRGAIQRSASEHGAALAQIARAALLVEHPVPDAGRGVLLAEVIRTSAQMGATELADLVTAVLGLPDQLLLLGCAPAVLPRMESLLDPAGPQQAGLPEHCVVALARLLTRLRSAALHLGDERLLARSDAIFLRLLARAQSGELSPETVVAIRRVVTVPVLRSAGEDLTAAGRLVAPALPLLLSGGDDYGLAWLLWWQKDARSVVQPHRTQQWISGTATALVQIALRLAGLDPSATLQLPAGAAHADRGWTYGEASGVVPPALHDLLATAPPVFLPAALRAVLRGVQEVATADPESTAALGTVTVVLDALPAVGDGDPRAATLLSHRIALEMWRHGLWDAAPTESGGSVLLPTAAATAAAGGLLVAAAELLPAPDALGWQVINSLVEAWWRGAVDAGHPVDPAAVRVLVAMGEASGPIRGLVRARLQRRRAPAAVYGPLACLFARDPRILGRLLELAHSDAPGHFSDVAGLLLAAFSDRSLIRRRDADLLYTARCLSRLLRRQFTPSRVGELVLVEQLVSALRAWGGEPDALDGARAAAELLDGEA